MPVLSQDLDFYQYYVIVIFVLNDLRWEEVVCFVDIECLPSLLKLSFHKTIFFVTMSVYELSI